MRVSKHIKGIFGLVAFKMQSFACSVTLVKHRWCDFDLVAFNAIRGYLVHLLVACIHVTVCLLLLSVI